MLQQDDQNEILQKSCHRIITIMAGLRNITTMSCYQNNIPQYDVTKKYTTMSCYQNNNTTMSCYRNGINNVNVTVQWMHHQPKGMAPTCQATTL